MSKVSMKVFLSSILLLSILNNCTLNKSNEPNKTNDLIGVITFAQIQDSEHATWFNKEIGSYVPDTETLADFDNNPERLKTLSIKIFLGTWCSDSQREVPRFYNILSYLNITNFEFIGLDRDKKSPNHLEKGMDIHHVPTFIIYQNGKEVNRIIETPLKSLEKDLVAIIQKKNYTPNYSK